MYTGHQYPQFFTASCIERQMLLEQDKYKDMVIEDLCSLSEHGWIKVYAFVLMPNHLHYLWHVHPSLNYTKVKMLHLRNVTQSIRQHWLVDQEAQWLNKFHSENRTENPLLEERLSVDLYTPKVMYQKLEYIHANPTEEKWKLCNDAKEYAYSSAAFYDTGIDRFGFLTHIGARGVWEKEPDRIQWNFS